MSIWKWKTRKAKIRACGSETSSLPAIQAGSPTSLLKSSVESIVSRAQMVSVRNPGWAQVPKARRFCTDRFATAGLHARNPRRPKMHRLHHDEMARSQFSNCLDLLRVKVRSASVPLDEHRYSLDRLRWSYGILGERKSITLYLVEERSLCQYDRSC